MIVPDDSHPLYLYLYLLLWDIKSTLKAAQTGDKVKLSTSFKKVRQVLEEIERFKNESMPDDGQFFRRWEMVRHFDETTSE